MRFAQALACFALAISAVNAVSVQKVDALDRLEQPHVLRSEILSPEHALEKRKGGGGKGGGGGGGGKSGGGKGGGGGASSRTRPDSNVGGATKSGSGAPRAYGGGYYGGGAATPYKAGGRTPKGLLAGALIAPAAVLLIMPGIWLYSVYPYHLSPYRFYNQTANRTESHNDKRQENNTLGANVTLPVVCLCEEFLVCGCDDNTDSAYIDSLVGNGSYAALNKTLVTVSRVNDTETLVINGTLPNGTTAPGGTDDAAAGLRINQYAGYWVMLMIVISTVALL